MRGRVNAMLSELMYATDANDIFDLFNKQFHIKKGENGKKWNIYTTQILIIVLLVFTQISELLIPSQR